MKSALRIRLLALPFTLLATATAHALSLDGATKAAQDNSPEIKQLQYAAESDDWGVTKARGGFLPKVNLSARRLTDEKFEVLDVEFGGGVFSMPAIQPYSSLGVNATWELFSGFETLNNYRAAQAMRQASEHRLKRAQEKMRVDIRTMFYRALGSQILVDVATQNIDTLEGHLKDINSRVRSGVSTRYDALRAEVQLEEARTEKVSAETNVAVARARLFEKIGIADDGQPLSGKLPEDFSPYEGKKIAIEDATREDRLAQLNDVEASQSKSRASQAHWMPKVRLFADHEWYNNNNTLITEDGERFQSAYSIGFQLAWNLYDGGISYASQRQSALAEKIANQKLARLDQATTVDLEESRRKLTYNIINYKAKLGSIRKAEEAVRLARGGVRAGTRTATEVLDAVVDLNRAKAASVKSQVDAIEAIGQLELVIGHSI